jgi:CheY-like chemotaxis protein
MSLLILVVGDEPDVETLFRQHFRRDLRVGRFIMEFAQSGAAAHQRINKAGGVSLIAARKLVRGLVASVAQFDATVRKLLL